MEYTDLFKQKATSWADQFSYCCVLDSNHYPDVHGRFELLIAAGAKQVIQPTSAGSFAQLQRKFMEKPDWMFGLLGYDLKNELEQLHSENPDFLNFPELCFFMPQHLIVAKDSRIEVLIGDPAILDEILAFEEMSLNEEKVGVIQSRLDKRGYIEQVNALQEHIKRGDVYEATYCQEFFAENTVIDPVEIFKRLNRISPSPFSGYLKIKHQYVLCASPERFLSRRGSRLVSQPIKGTAARGLNAAEDLALRDGLRNDLKEQTENVMIVDLVRNDLTRSAVAGTVEVTELFGIYTFPQVHQMISTIACDLNPKVHFIEAIKNTFPMGSMTGAPKIRAMKLIEELEYSKRGAFSGAMGYFTPEGDFDLNVIIRSIFYDAKKLRLSFQVGGAITYAANAEQEYDECMLKASAMLKAIKGPD